MVHNVLQPVEEVLFGVVEVPLVFLVFFLGFYA